MKANDSLRSLALLGSTVSCSKKMQEREAVEGNINGVKGLECTIRQCAIGGICGTEEGELISKNSVIFVAFFFFRRQIKVRKKLSKMITVCLGTRFCVPMTCSQSTYCTHWSHDELC